MTPGEAALIEAARLETARVYGGLCPDKKTQPAGLAATVAEAVLEASVVPINRPPKVPKRVRTLVEQAVARGWTPDRIAAEYPVTVEQVRCITEDMDGVA